MISCTQQQFCLSQLWHHKFAMMCFPSKNHLASLLIFVAVLCSEFCDGQLAQWIAPYLPVVPGGIADVSTSSPSGLVYRQREVLNATTGTTLEWSVHRINDSLSLPSITFNFTTNTNSSSGLGVGDYIVLGLSKRGNVEGADVVLVRRSESGQVELLDMHGTDNETISQDATQNWRLINATAAANLTLSLIISRNLDTCDTAQDIVINNDMLHVIWGSGSNLSTASNRSPVPFTPDGDIRAYLADPVRPNITQPTLQTWRISRTFQVPPRRTSYWCSIHKGLSLQNRHHIVGYTPYFSNATSEQHVHHQLVYRCIAPPGMDAALIFDRFVSHSGEECYLENPHQLPTHLCSEIIHFWAVGGKGFTFPQNVGLSLGEAQNEYFMLESHYDNPDLRADLVVENGADFYYSPEIQPVEGGIIFIGSGVLGLYMVPPNTTSFRHGGQCSSQCTQEMLGGVGGGGADLMVAMLHSHMTTNKMRLKHYRGGQELPWILNDDNYDFSFQQIRHLPKPVKILPGDQVGVECVMNTSSRNATTLAGFSTTDEMCVTFVMVDKRLGYVYCSSEYPTQTTLNRYGIQNVTWDRELQERVINQANDTNYVGRTLQDVLDNENLEVWTDERKRQLENEQYFGTHDSVCPKVRKYAMLAYANYFVEGVTAGLISRTEVIENTRPSTRMVSTPSRVVTDTVWPRPLVDYRGLPQCNAR